MGNFDSALAGEGPVSQQDIASQGEKQGQFTCGIDLYPGCVDAGMDPCDEGSGNLNARGTNTEECAKLVGKELEEMTSAHPTCGVGLAPRSADEVTDPCRTSLEEHSWLGNRSLPYACTAC